MGESLRGCERIGDSVRGWVSRARLGESLRGWVSLMRLGSKYRRLWNVSYLSTSCINVSIVGATESR
jgi:hypothetical protein